MDHLNDDEVNQTELVEWLRSTDVLEEDVQRSRSAPKAAASSSAQRPKRRDFIRRSSLDDHVPSDRKIFGIDADTALSALGKGFASSKIRKTHNPWASSSSSSSSHTVEPPPQESSVPPTRRPFDRSSYHQPIIDLTATDNNLDEPLTCAPVGASPSSIMLHHSPVDFNKRARMSFEDNNNNINVEESQMPLVDQTSASSSTAEGGGGMRTQSCHTTRCSSAPEDDFMTRRQKMYQQGPRRTSLLPESMPPLSKDSSSPTSFFRNMDDQSSHFYRMMSSSGAECHGDAMDISDTTTNMMDSSDNTKMSSSSYFNDELQSAMEQTQQSRRLILDAFLDSSARSDGNNVFASSAGAGNVAAAVGTLEEFGMQCGVVGKDCPPHPLPTSADTTRATAKVEVTATEAKAKRHLKRIAREQLILEKRFANGGNNMVDLTDDSDDDEVDVLKVAAASNDFASSANVTAAAGLMEEFGMLCGVVGRDGPSHAHPLPTSADTTRTTAKFKVAAAEAEAKRHLERIAREQMILEEVDRVTERRYKMT